MSGWDGWVGRERVVEERLGVFPARGMAALLDRDPGAHSLGSVLPRGWHWLYFHEPARRSDLGPDGHERLGAFLPPLPLPRRMWAGGRLAFAGDLRLGERATRRSTVARIEEKEGKSGRLVFVTVRHLVETERGVAVDEEQDLVYRAAGAAGAPPPGPAAPTDPAWSEEASADPVTLFRFSALTFNGHRIHYDRPYATGEEGYPGLVVHGPLLALLLLDAAGRRGGRGPVERFAYRARSPLFAEERFRLEGRAAPEGGEGRPAADAAGSPEGASIECWVRGPRGVAMDARAASGGAR